MSAADDAAIFQMNQADSSIVPDYDPDLTEDDPDGPNRPHNQHQHRRFDYPRLSEQPRGMIPPLTPPALPASKRVPFTQLSPRTRERDRDLYGKRDK